MYHDSIEGLLQEKIRIRIIQMIIKIIFLLNIKFLGKVDLKLIERFQLQKKEIY